MSLSQKISKGLYGFNINTDIGSDINSDTFFPITYTEVKKKTCEDNTNTDTGIGEPPQSRKDTFEVKSYGS